MLLPDVSNSCLRTVRVRARQRQRAVGMHGDTTLHTGTRRKIRPVGTGCTAMLRALRVVGTVCGRGQEGEAGVRGVEQEGRASCA